ncbi:hypothetical protein C7S16_4153 [Burkholderia thailandensis]|uniref:Uncharacterized protein n=1 Tax=Burkholderia thailandensis TaxID=57975 RepID=A0AAW9CTV0_BURTH|nr:hypothetical protein [Burkholderia thailandensis]MDW9252538.1 hypothetical protein [Burkholderia thailandensis]
MIGAAARTGGAPPFAAFVSARRARHPFRHVRRDSRDAPQAYSHHHATLRPIS